MRIPNFVKKGWDHVKKWWDRLPKLPRRWRIVRNLALAAVLVLLVLVLLEWPSLSSYRAFQRLEGAYLLTPSRLVFQVERGNTVGYLSEGDSWITVGSVETYNDAGKPLNIDKKVALLHQVLPKEGIVVVILPAKNEDNGAVAAVWGAPEQAVSGTWSWSWRASAVLSTLILRSARSRVWRHFPPRPGGGRTAGSSSSSPPTTTTWRVPAAPWRCCWPGAPSSASPAVWSSPTG